MTTKEKYPWSDAEEQTKRWVALAGKWQRQAFWEGAIFGLFFAIAGLLIFYLTR